MAGIVKRSVKIQQDGTGLIDCACGQQVKVNYASGDYAPCTCGFVYTSTGWIVNSGDAVINGGAR